MKKIYNLYAKHWFALLCFIGFAVSASAQFTILNNGYLRMGNGNENSVNNLGNVQQPFYYNGTLQVWRKLTYSTYPLDYAVAVSGDKTNQWNLNGTIGVNPTLNGQVIDYSNYIATSATTGYGSIKSTGTVNVGGKNLRIEQTYTLPQASGYVAIKVKVTNLDATLAENVRIWVGTRDDWVGDSDVPNKLRGNIINGAFVQNATSAQQSKALKISTNTEAVLVYTNSNRGYTTINSCCQFQNSINQDPATASTNLTNDGSYAFYVRMNDLAANASDEFTWYYAAGSLADIDDIINEVAQASGSVQNITCTNATYNATASANGTGYWITVPQGSTAPTAAQIKAGVAYGSVTPISAGSGAMTANTQRSFNIGGLSSMSNYTVYFVHEDAVPQFSAVINSNFSTPGLPAAVITAGGATTFCDGGSVMLNAPSGTGLTYLWSNYATTQNITVTTSGTYSVTISNECNNSVTSNTIQVTVNTAPTVAISVSGNTTFCSGGNVQLSTTNQGGYNYQWNRNGSPIANANAYQYTATTTGNYMVNVTANGCSSQATTTVNVVDAPAVAVTPATATINYGDNITLTAGVASTQEYLINLSNLVDVQNDCGSGSRYGGYGSPIGISWTDIGTGTVSNVKIELSFGVECHSSTTFNTSLNNVGGPSFSQPNNWCTCSTPSSEQIKIIDIASPTGYVTGGTNTFLITNTNTAIGFFPAPSLGNVYARVTVTYGSGASAVNYLWSPGNATTNSIAVSPTSNTTYTVTATNTTGCSANATASVTVNPPPVSFTLSKTDAACPNQSSGTLTITPSGATGTVEYSLNNGAFATLVNNTVSGLPAGNYSVRIKNNGFTTTAQSITITETPDNTPPTVNTQNVTVQLDANGAASVTPAQINNGSNDNCGIDSVTVSPSSFTCANVGNNTVTLRVKDVNGNVSTTTATVTVQDNVAPNAIAQNVTVQLDANGAASVTPAQVNNGSSDNCGIDSVTVSPSSFTCANVGNNTVTLRVKDVNGNVSTTTATVTVQDNVAPTATAQNVTVQLDANGAASITPAQINNGSNDNCGIDSVTVSPSSFTCANVGNNTVTLRVKDVNGNVSTTTATVTVQDNVAPTATAQNVTVQLDSNGSASITAAQVNNGSSDNCAIATMSVSPSTFTCSNIGSTQLPVMPYGWWRAENNFTDHTPNANNGTGVYNPTFATGNCGQGFVFNGVGSHVDVGTNTNFNGAASMTIAAWIKPGSNGDEDQIVSKSTHGVPSSWEFRKYGSTLQYTYKATNGVQYAASANVLAANTWQHVAATWDGTTMRLFHNGILVNTSSGAPMTTNSLSMKIGENQGFGDSHGAYQGNIDEVMYFTSSLSAAQINSIMSCVGPAGNAVTLTVTDINGNSSTATATVTVQDNVAPNAIAQNVTKQLDANGAASVTPAQVNNGSSDNCGIDSVTVSPSSFTCANVGNNTVTLRVKDVNGNVSTTTATVTVNDVTAPTVTCAANITAYALANSCSTNVTVTSPTTSDNCSATNYAAIVAPFAANDANLSLWIDATKFSTNQGSNLNGVLNDASGKRTVTTNATFETAGFNGRPSVRYNNNQTATSAFTTNANTYVFTTVQIIAASNSWASVFYQWNRDMGLTIEQNPFSPNAAPSGTAQYHFQTGNDNTNVERNVTYGTSYIMAAKITGGNVRSFTLFRNNNGTLENLGTSTNSSFNLSIQNGALYIGRSDAGEYTNMRMGEFIYFQNAMPAGISESSVVNYLYEKWLKTSSVNLTNSYNNTANASAVYPIGTTNITWTARDASNNASTCQQTVTVIDTISPTVITQNVTIQLNASGTASTTATAVNNGSTDNCGIETIVLSKTSFDCSNVGNNTVTLTVTDVNGNVSTRTATVTVQDNIAPTATAQNVTILLNSSGAVSITAAQINNGSSDNCAVDSVTVSPSSFTCANVGNNTVTLRVKDVNGNVTTTTATVTVRDSVAPNAIAQNVTAQLNINGAVSVSAAQINNGSSDNCGIASIICSRSGGTGSAGNNVLNGTLSGGNATVVSVTGLNGATNYRGTSLGTTCNEAWYPNGTLCDETPNVNNPDLSTRINPNAGVTWHNPSPGNSYGAMVIDLGSPKFVNAISLFQMFSDGKATHVRGFAIPSATSVPAYNDASWTELFPYTALGAQTISGTTVSNPKKLSFTGVTTRYVMLYVKNDGTLGNGTWIELRQAKLFSTTQPCDFSCIDIGNNNVTLTVTDVNGNVSTTTATVTVQDNIAPNPIAQNVTVQLDANGAASVTPAQVNNGSNDNCGIDSVTVSPSSFTCANVGNNTVTLRVKDVNGNVSTTTATVTVQDNIAPNAIAQNVTVQLDANGAASVTPAQVNNGSTDNCGIDSVTVSPSSFTCANVGNNTVTLGVKDVNGNVSTTTATVTVQDNVAPNAIAQNVTVQLDANGAASVTPAQVNNGSNDNCGIDSVTVSPSSFTCANVGNNTVTLRVKDVNGNVSTTTATVTVQDNVAPNAIAQNVTVQLDANGAASVTPAQVNNGSNDNCGIDSVTVSPSSFTCANVGNNTVTLRVKDVNGNVSTTTATVTVQDNVAPNAIAQNVTVQLDANGAASVTPAQVNNGSNDNCGIDSVTVSPSSFTCANVGNNTVTLRVKDVNGNVSTTTATVTVQDNIAPNAIAQNVTVQLDANGAASVTPAQVNNGSNDNCGIDSVTVSPSSFTCANVGNNTVTLRVKDVNGNVSTTTATVTVQDNILPTAIAKNISVTLANGTVGITPAQVNNGSFDNCGIASMTVSPNTFNCTKIGANTVTLTITDVNGNVKTTTATVTVIGAIPTVSISQGVQPGLTQGGAVVLTASSPTAISYNWTGGPATQSYNVYASGSYTVTATNQYGCTKTAITAVSYTASSLLSSYVIIAEKEVKLKDNVIIHNGGVGVTSSCGEVEFDDNSKAIATGTFVRAKEIDVECGSQVNNKIYAATLTSILPAFLTNPYCNGNSNNNHCNHSHHNSCGNGNNCNGNGYGNRNCNHSHHGSCGNNNGCNNSHHNSCAHNYGGNCNHSHHGNCSSSNNNSNNNKNIAQNATITITDSIMGTVVVGKNATVTFTAPRIYIKDFEIKEGATVKFTQCAVIRVCNHVDMGKGADFNTINTTQVSMYINKKLKVQEGSVVIANVYAKEDIEIKGKNNAPTVMKGLFIGEEVKAEKYVGFYYNTVTTCANNNYKTELVEDEKGLITNFFDADVYPNPAVSSFSIRLFSSSTEAFTVEVFDMQGKLIETNVVNHSTLHESMGANYAEGMYLIKITQGNNTKTMRLVRANK